MCHNVWARMNATPGIPLSRSKVVLPRRREELYSRPRLLNLLNKSLDKKLILISAPAGYGKTSLLIDLAHNCELPIAWLSLDEFDRECQRFIAYFITAITERFPEFGRQSMEALNALVSPESGLESLVVTLTNEIFEKIREHFVLVLDDYHLVENVPLIRDFINRVLKLVDENFHLILSSRLLIYLPDLPRLVAMEEVDGLDFSDLAFRPEEIQALLLSSRGVSLPEKDAQDLADQSEGWITGLQLSGFSKNPAAPSRLARVTGVNLDGYFEQQVLSRQGQVLRESLLYTSLFDEFDAELCRAVLDPLFPEPQDWSAILKDILLNNLFVLTVGSDGRWLRYHHLFRDFLRGRLKAEHPEVMNGIYVRLIRAYEQRGEWERAYYTSRTFNDPEELAGLVERAGPTMLRRAVSTLNDWLNALPPALANSHPGLLSLRGGIGYLRGNYKEALTLLNDAVALYRKNGNAHGLALALVRRATAYRNLSDHTAALRDAEDALSLTQNEPQLQSIYAEALRVQGLSLYRLGRTHQAIACLEHSLALNEQLHETDSVPILVMNCGMVYRAMGEYEAAERAYLKALAIWKADANLSWQSAALNNLGSLYHVLGEYEKASLTLQEGLSAARKSRYLQIETAITIALGELYAELGEYEGARQAFEQAEAINAETQDRTFRNYLALMKISLALAQDQTVEAGKSLRDVHKDIETGKSQYELGLWSLFRGRLALIQKDVQASIAELERAEAHFIESGRALETSWSQIWLAAALASAGDPLAEEKIKSLLQGKTSPPHAVVAAFRNARPFLEHLRKDARLARAVSILYNRADQLDARLPALRRALRRLPQAVAMTAPKLVIRALGWPHVTVNGQTVEWPTQSVCELFFYFLTSEQPLSKEQIAEAMWPDQENPERLRQRFKNELYRLRRAVGPDVILLDSELYRFNHALDYDYDVDDFETYLSRARSARDAREQIVNFEKAVELVNGSYLSNIGAAWTTFDREHLHLDAIDAALRLAELCWEQGDFSRSMTACHRALEFDPTSEPAHRLLMKIHTARNDRAALLRQYKTCKNALAALGFPLSEETETLFKELNLRTSRNI